MSYSAEFEAREAAHWSGESWQRFRLRDGEEQSATVAHYRVHHYLEAVLAEDAARRAKSKAKT